MYHCLGDFYQDCPNHVPGVKIGPAPGGQHFSIEIYSKIFKNKTFCPTPQALEPIHLACNMSDDSLFKLLNYFNYMQNSGCHGNGKEKLKKYSSH